MELLIFAFYILFVAEVGFYSITNLQWYNYKINRVIFHHTKSWWHIVYFLVPFLAFTLTYHFYQEFSPIVVVIYSIMLFLWQKNLDKKLVFTGRVKRFLIALAFFTVFIYFVTKYASLMIPLFLAYIASTLIEKMLYLGYKKQAIKKLNSMENLIIIGITASYGKTSIKNYIAHLLSTSYKTYATPRSVNTFAGVMKDINMDLPLDTEVYIVEMGARVKGDIKELTTFVNPHYVVVGKIGTAHIEYFKTLENIRNTKMEIVQTKNLKEAWIDNSAMVKEEENIHTFGRVDTLDIKNPLPTPKYLIKDIKSSLNGIEFNLEDKNYKASILGDFNASNIAVSILIAKKLGVKEEEIEKQLKTLKQTSHRLEKIEAGGKIILDDSFNGNIDGMLSSFNLSSTHKGRKVVITPGLVEVDKELNIQVAKKSNEIFDLVIVTGDLNYPIFKEYINKDKLLKLEDKSKMQEFLATHTKSGDLILFANDAPNFI